MPITGSGCWRSTRQRSPARQRLGGSRRPASAARGMSSDSSPPTSFVRRGRYLRECAPARAVSAISLRSRSVGGNPSHRSRSCRRTSESWFCTGVRTEPCRICHRSGDGHFPPFCGRCRGIRRRVETRWAADRLAWEAALRKACDLSTGSFRCCYTGVELLDDPRTWPHPRYLVREHQTPGDEARLEVCCHAVNQMKGALADEAFRCLAVELSERLLRRDGLRPDLEHMRRRLAGVVAPGVATPLAIAIGLGFRSQVDVGFVTALLDRDHRGTRARLPRV